MSDTVHDSRRVLEEGESLADAVGLAHSTRFRRVSNRYPLQVTYAYAGDVKAAAADDDAAVTARVAAWELAQGLEPRDWAAIGRCEKGTASEADEAYHARLFDDAPMA